MKFNVFQFLGLPRYILASCFAICLAFLLENGFMARARKKLTASSKLRREILVWSSIYLQHVTLLAELKQNQESIIIIQLFTFMNMEWTSQKKKNKTQQTNNNSKLLVSPKPTEKKEHPFYMNLNFRPWWPWELLRVKALLMGKGIRVWYLGTTPFNPKFTFSLQIGWRVPTEKQLYTSYP